MYNVELFVICVYCLIWDDLYPAFCARYGRPRRAGFAPQLSDCECLTIEGVGPYWGYSAQKHLFEKMKDRFGSLFPALVDRPAFIRQSANLWPVKAGIWQRIAPLLDGHNARYQIIDTLAIPVLKQTSQKRRRIFRNATILDMPPAPKGYCAARNEAYFGFKGGLRITDYGLIVQASLLHAYGHDSADRDELLEGVHAGTTVMADSAFLELSWQQTGYRTERLVVLTPITV